MSNDNVPPPQAPPPQQPPPQPSSAPAPGPAPPPGGNAAPWRPPPLRRRNLVLIAVLAIAALLFILSAWDLPPFGGRVQTTDNAYVRGRVAFIAPQVSGYVVAVHVHDYQDVRKGQPLVSIDDRIYRARVEQARANLAAQRAALANSAQARASRSAGIDSQVAGLANARAQLLRAQADMARAEDLVRDGSISIRERDQTAATLRQAEAGVRQSLATQEIARQDLRTVDVGRAGLQAQVEAAAAQLHLAEIDLGNTVIRAPESGQVGEVGVRLGQYVTNGVQLMALVPPDRWIIANFKEQQIARMKRGQKVRFTVDALGGEEMTGRAERLSPAAGSEFAVLKPDNATGNFVKVPQRIGVRISIDPGQAALPRLRPGMSVVVHVDDRSP
ncbi:HlyD family secretion protein [Lysobacter sp. A6]|uniref:HlyD family secretion protein n=1 Tax=Noviluteimonas lactosilytica TaxID=2888523 RepID=A0ABS8JJG8_9GAMM|nr:HlyD family secretion protein [Lysobacter lactosilyticus]MCC8363753.1 HlyD family secretion protein [Lysobacter lactosilyticus]